MLWDSADFTFSTVGGRRVVSLAAGGLAHDILSATHGDSTAAAVVRGDIMIGSGVVPKWTRLARSVPAANVLNVLGLANGDLEPAWKTVLDATAPVNVSLAAAAAGTSLVFSHRDHGHLLDVAIAPTWTGKHIFGGSRTLSGQLDAIVNINGAVTTSVAVQALLAINGTMSVGHDVPVALLVRPFLTFTANVNEAFGGSLAAFINPNAGITVALAAGFRGVLASSAGTGTITRAAAIRADSFVVAGGPTPVTNIGVDIALMNSGTNNYQMGIGEVDLTVAGTYYGRYSVLYNGLKKYVHVFNA